jgi:MFS superfamily sulfate permease-like transporter
MNIVIALLIVGVTAGVAIAAMLFVRRTAPRRRLLQRWG